MCQCTNILAKIAISPLAYLMLLQALYAGHAKALKCIIHFGMFT